VTWSDLDSPRRVFVLGPCDYLDIFEAPDETIAAKVVMIIRSYGHGQTETWTAMPWERFEIVLPS
jgi:uncharacterized protein with GYD domain